MNITIILGSVRENRVADIVLKKVKELIAGKTYDLTIVDPAEYNLPFLNKRFFEMTDPEEKFTKLHDIFLKTDGFIIITAEYNHSVPPALKNMLDHFLKEFRYKSCGIISYSISAVGGARATEQLRLICSTLGMPPIPSAPAWGFADKSNEAQGKQAAEAFEKSFNSFITQLEWYTQAYINQRKLAP